MRPDLGLLSWPLAPPQPRHPAMCKVTPPVAHRTGVHPESGGDLLGAPPFQRQQDRPRPVRFLALLRFRQGAQCGPFRNVSRQLRFSRHACLHSPHPRQTIQSIAYSQAVCLARSAECRGQRPAPKSCCRPRPAPRVGQVSEPGWRVAYNSVIGTSHEKTGLPCQDAGGCRIVHDPAGREILLAIACDGAGSASRSLDGATLAVSQFLNQFSEAAKQTACE